MKLSKLEDPLGFLGEVLRRQAHVLSSIESHPKTSIAGMFAENAEAVRECQRDIKMAYGTLRIAILDVGTSSQDTMHEEAKKLQEVLGVVVRAAQKCIDLLDDLSARYGLPESEPLLFRKIGTLLYT